MDEWAPTVFATEPRVKVCSFCDRRGERGFYSGEMLAGGLIYACEDHEKCDSRHRVRVSRQQYRERNELRGRPSRASAAMTLMVLAFLFVALAR